MKKILLAIVIIIGLLIFAVWHRVDQKLETMTVSREQSELRQEPVTMGKEPVGVLILGVDGSDGGRAATEGDENNVRADSIIYAAVDVESAQVSMVSIPRDTYVYIPCIDGEDKITNAYHYGLLENPDDPNAGIQCTIGAVENFLNLPVDYFVQLNFNGFIAMIDAIGGITITANNTFCEQDEFDTADAYCFEEGVTYEMTGSMALAYARHRKTDNDYMRGLRQQQVVTATIDKIMTDPINYTLAIIDVVQQYVVTNVSAMEVIYSGIAVWRNGIETYGDSLIIDNHRIYGADDYDNDNQFIFIPYEESIDYIVSAMEDILFPTPSELEPFVFPIDDEAGVFYEGTPYTNVSPD